MSKPLKRHFLLESVVCLLLFLYYTDLSRETWFVVCSPLTNLTHVLIFAKSFFYIFACLRTADPHSKSLERVLLQGTRRTRKMV
jgi:hypothetical protein